MKRIIRSVIFIVLSIFVCRAVIFCYSYPVKYYDIVQENSRKYGVDPMIIMAIIKAESSFNKYAVSSKNSIGLMQLQENTASWCALKMGIDDFDTSQLYDEDINIKIGTWYFASFLLGYFDGDITLSLAAYNAGIGNVSNWQKNSEYSSDSFNLDRIPFPETENYIKKVYEYYYTYKSMERNIFGMRFSYD